MPRKLELRGQRFGRLTVIDKIEKKGQGYQVWRCLCDCGKEVTADTRQLKRETITSCGCIPPVTARKGQRAENLEGKKFGRLTVISRTENKGGRVTWLCRCDCGKIHKATAHDLKSGKVTSCGCRKTLNENRIIDLTGQCFGRLTVLRPTVKRDKKGSVIWKCLCDCGNETEVTEDRLVYGGYRSCGCLQREQQKKIQETLHRVDGTCVEWLEKRKHRKDNTSGFRGVTVLKNGRFRVSIGFKGRRYHVGIYKNYEEAVSARLEAEQQIHGGFIRAYYRWKEKGDENIPLIFQVEKREGKFQITTNQNPEKNQR